MSDSIVEALTGMRRTQSRENIPVPRLFRLKMSELQDPENAKTGGKFSVLISGTIKSLDDDDNVMVNVTNVNNNPPETRDEEQPEIRVMTQESVAP